MFLFVYIKVYEEGNARYPNQQYLPRSLHITLVYYLYVYKFDPFIPKVASQTENKF